MAVMEYSEQISEIIDAPICTYRPCMAMIEGLEAVRLNRASIINPIPPPRSGVS